MIVYRFERQGIGPYVSRRGSVMVLRTYRKNRSAKKYNARLTEYLKSGNVSRSDNWSKAHSDKKYMYGCKSKDQLRAYFGGNFKDLFKEGFRIKRYRVPDEEVIDMQIEVAFPVRYHKLQTVKKIQEVRV